MSDLNIVVPIVGYSIIGFYLVFTYIMCNKL